jgi:hypothetical protein
MRRDELTIDESIQRLNSGDDPIMNAALIPLNAFADFRRHRRQ